MAKEQAGAKAIQWLPEPEEHNYPAAQSYLSLLHAPEKVDGLIGLVEGVMGHGRIMNDPEVMRRLPAMALDFLRVRAAAGTRV